MKNIFRTVLLTALACLLCFSCTNINDPETLTADKFTVNKMKVEGFYVEGLADDYDQETVQLMYAVKDKDNKEQSTLIAEAIVGGKDESTVPGKAYVKLAEPKIVEGNGTYYLKFKDDDKTKVQVLNKKMAYENADVGMLSSPYGTKDDALVSKFMVVKATPVVGEGIPATFAWDDAKNVAKPAVRKDLLETAFFAINGPMGIKPLTKENSYTVEFTAVEKSWGAGDGDMNFTAYAQATEAARDDNDKWWDKVVYRFGGFDVNLGTKTECKSDGDNITIKGITNGNKYKAVFTSTPSKVYVTITEVTE